MTRPIVPKAQGDTMHSSIQRTLVAVLAVTTLFAFTAIASPTHKKAMASPKDLKMSGTAHIELTGGISLSQNLAVKSCQIYTSLDSAYTVDLLDGSKIVLPKYKGTGNYTFSEAAPKPTYPNFAYQFVDLKLKEGKTLVEPEKAHVDIAITEAGKKGQATFKDYKTNDGALVSGQITWTCDEVTIIIL
jgi:hypothetical protein